MLTFPYVTSLLLTPTRYAGRRDFEVIATKHVFEDYAMKKFVKQISRKIPSSQAFRGSSQVLVGSRNPSSGPSSHHHMAHQDSMSEVHRQLLKTKAGQGRESKVASMLQAQGNG